MKKLLGISFLGLFLLTCETPERVSSIPEIEFISFELKNTFDTLGNEVIAGFLTFSFIDGDGDLGNDIPKSENAEDSLQHQEALKNAQNLFLDFYYKDSGNYIREQNDPVFYPENNYTIPVLKRQMGQNNTLIGEIEIRLDYYKTTEKFKYDTIKYDFYIRDRKNHFSNTESTNDIALEFDKTR
jgi:hypothetical protein